MYAVQLLPIIAAYEHNRHLKLKMFLVPQGSLVLSKAEKYFGLLIWAEQSSQKRSFSGFVFKI